MSNLKDAEDYYKELPYLGPFLSSAQGYDVFLSTIKQVQRDTIALTAKMCAKNAKTITEWEGNTTTYYTVERRLINTNQPFAHLNESMRVYVRRKL